MKKSILFIFALIPMLASCNNSENGFINPFPGDPAPTGFDIKEEGKIVRSLISQEVTLINQTIDLAKNKNLYSCIKEKNVIKNERDYTRAFAGEFAQGYDSSNKKLVETQVVYRQDPDSSNDITYLRNVSETHSDTIIDYSYGQNKTIEDTKIYHYLSKNEFKKYVESGINEANSTCEQVFKGKSDSPDEPFSYRLDLHTDDTDSWYEPDIQISQDSYIFNPNTATLSGVNSTGNPILIKESHRPYIDESDPQAKEGIYKLKDGREYRAAFNELYVTTLDFASSDLGNESTDWYIVKQSRHYIETSITSDVIQPNVPISYLADPIMVAYTEEIINFSTTLAHTTQTAQLHDLPIEEPEA